MRANDVLIEITSDTMSITCIFARVSFVDDVSDADMREVKIERGVIPLHRTWVLTLTSYHPLLARVSTRPLPNAFDHDCPWIRQECV